MKTAIVLGATGLTGSLLLNKLVKDDNYKTIKVLREDQQVINHQKLKNL